MSFENMSFENRSVFVTGGAGALGKAVVDWFSVRGARVAVLDYSDDLLANSFPDPSEKHFYIACDLTDRKSCIFLPQREVYEQSCVERMTQLKIEASCLCVGAEGRDRRLCLWPLRGVGIVRAPGAECDRAWRSRGRCQAGGCTGIPHR